MNQLTAISLGSRSSIQSNALLIPVDIQASGKSVRSPVGISQLSRGSELIYISEENTLEGKLHVAL
jgi:hypothetical protein